MSRKSLILIILIATALFLFLHESKSTSVGSVLKIGISTMPNSMNPVYATNETSSILINKIFESLYFFDAHGTIQSGLADYARISDINHHSEIILRVKPHIYFSDGRELNAGDVVETVALMKNPAFQYPYFSTLEIIKDVEQLDRYGVRIRFQGSLGNWKHYLTFKILNGREIRNTSPNRFRQQKLTGTGPYRLSSLGDLSGIVLEKNKYYRFDGEGGNYDRLEFSLQTYPPLSPLKLCQQELDICELQPEHIDAYQKQPAWQESFKICRYKKLGFTFLVFNLRQPQLNRNIRDIFYQVLIGQEFPSRFLQGRGEVVTSPFPLPAKSMLALPRRAQKPDQKVVLHLLVNAESLIRRNFALFLAAELAPWNIELVPELLEYHSFLDYIKSGRFEVALSAMLMDVEDDIATLFRADSGFNYASYQNPQMNTLLAGAAREGRVRARQAIYRQAHQLWQDGLPFIPLFNLYYYMGVSRRVGVPEETYTLVGANSDFLFNIEKWRVQTGQRVAGHR